MKEPEMSEVLFADYIRFEYCDIKAHRFVKRVKTFKAAYMKCVNPYWFVYFFLHHRRTDGYPDKATILKSLTIAIKPLFKYIPKELKGVKKELYKWVNSKGNDIDELGEVDMNAFDDQLYFRNRYKLQRVKRSVALLDPFMVLILEDDNDPIVLQDIRKEEGKLICKGLRREFKKRGYVVTK